MANLLARWSALSAIALVAALTACGSGVDGPPANMDTSKERAAQHRELRTRPDIHQVTQHYDEMQAAVRERLSREMGLAQWIKRNEISTSGCRDYPEVDQGLKESRILPRWALETGIPDDKWPDAVRIVTEIAGGYGFGNPIVTVDQPGRHEVSLSDQYGGELIFGTRINTAMYARTGCHWRPDRGSPSPTTSTT